MIGAEFGVDAVVELAVARVAHVEHLVAAVQFRLLLLDDVGLDGHAEVVRLRRQVGRDVVVLAVLLERVVAEVAPEDGGHPEFVGPVERLRDLDDLPIRILGAEVDRRTDRRGAELPGLVDGAEHDLAEVVRIGQQLVVVQLHDEGDPVGVLPAHAPQHPEGGRHRVASALDREFDDLLAVEVDRVLREARAGGVFDALVDRKDRHVPGAAEPTVVVDRLDVPHHLRVPIARRPDPVDEVGAGQVQEVLGDLG